MRISPLRDILFALSILCLPTILLGQATGQQTVDLKRGARNYEEVMAGKKKYEMLSPQERLEYLLVSHRRATQSEDNKSPECREARSRAASAAAELADRSRRLRSCAEALDYTDSCSGEFSRVKAAQSDYEDAVLSVGDKCRYEVPPVR